MSDTSAVDTNQISIETTVSSNTNIENNQRGVSNSSLVMPSVVQPGSITKSEKDELIFKLEPGTEIVEIGASPGHEPTAQFENDACSGNLNSAEPPAFVGEEPLEIQCGENTALLYVSKLCQGSKGPCILFNNEWLTPNELQYISGRETAKDWKRSIRFKGKSLKSLIARGLIKVHPPICDCLGCRISSPVNRGRLASKCGIAPPSPRSRKRDATKSLSGWTHEDIEGASSHRHYSTSDIENFPHRSMINGYKDARPASNSSTASECSELPDDSPFSPVVKTVSAPEVRLDERRGSVSHYINSPKDDYDKALSTQRMIQLNQEQDPDANKDQSVPNEKTDKTRSAFRSVQQDAITSAVSESDAKDLTSRSAKIKQRTQSTGSAPTSPFLPPYTQYPGPTMASPTSPRLVPDHLLFANPHGNNLYHHAFRGTGFHGIPHLPRSLMQYRLLNSPGTGNSSQSPLAGLSIQSQLQMMHDMAAVNGGKKRPMEENGVPHKRRRSSNEHSDDKSNNSVFSDDESGSPKKDNGHHSDKINHVSVIHKSPAHSPLPVDAGSEVKNRSEDGRSKPHRLIPKLRLNTDECVINWDVSQVCEFVSSLTGSSEIANEFKEQCIDGQSLILLKEEHLLNKLGIKLGPALKILAHIEKLIERMTIDDHATDASESV